MTNSSYLYYTIFWVRVKRFLLDFLRLQELLPRARPPELRQQVLRHLCRHILRQLRNPN